MPRREVRFEPDQYYHIYNRGNNRQAIFFEQENYIYFLRGVRKYLLETMVIVAYCLMPTHYHLLVRIKQVEQTQTSEVSKTSEVCSRAMQKFLISYTKAINKRFDRVGALFQGQFQAKPIQTDQHLQTLCIYIHANPVKDGLVTLPEEWPYSNYLEWMGMRKGTLVDHAFVANQFGTTQAYQALVADYIKTRKVSDEIRAYLETLEG